MDGSLADVLPSMHALHSHLQHCQLDLEARKEYPDIRKQIRLAIEKLDKYLDPMYETPIYLIAVVCDPRRNLDWIIWAFQQRNKPVEPAMRAIREFFESYLDRSDDFVVENNDGGRVTFDSWPAKEISSEPDKGVMARGEEEYRTYTLLRPMEYLKVIPMVWWRDNGPRFKTWYKIASMVLSIPAMSAEIERIFSRYALEVINLMTVLAPQQLTNVVL